MNLEIKFPNNVTQFELVNYWNAKNDDPKFMECHYHFQATEKYSIFIIPISHKNDPIYMDSPFLYKTIFRLEQLTEE
jgi:hypothetical protein